MDFYNVLVCKFIDLEDHVYVKRLIVDNYVQHICTVDFENRIATDIMSGEEFYILAKNNENRILSSEKSKIEMNTNYGVELKPLNYSKLGTKEQIKLSLLYLKLKLSKQQKIKKK